MRAHATQFEIDPDHIGAFGCSRGAHIAAMIGVTDPSAEMEGEEFGFAEQSSRVQAVVMFDGVARLSPISYVTDDDPPFLLIASKDPHYQNEARVLVDALSTQGVSATYLEADGASHCQYALSGPHTSEKMSTIIGDFFEENLK